MILSVYWYAVRSIACSVSWLVIPPSWSRDRSKHALDETTNSALWRSPRTDRIFKDVPRPLDHETEILWHRLERIKADAICHNSMSSSFRHYQL